MVKPIGRIWNNGHMISGYLVISPGVIVKFGSTIPQFKGNSFLFPPKAERESEEERAAEVEQELATASY